MFKLNRPVSVVVCLVTAYAWSIVLLHVSFLDLNTQNPLRYKCVVFYVTGLLRISYWCSFHQVWLAQPREVTISGLCHEGFKDPVEKGVLLYFYDSKTKYINVLTSISPGSGDWIQGFEGVKQKPYVLLSCTTSSQHSLGKNRVLLCGGGTHL